MGVRLILVSVVAGLGLTLPSGKQITSWRDSARGWVSTRLADWDARMPADESAFIYVSDAEPLPGEERETREIVTTSKTRDDAPADSPAQEPFKTVKAALEILAAGIESPTSPMAIDDAFLFPNAKDLNPASDLAALDTAFHEAQIQTLSVFAADVSHLADARQSLPKSEKDLAVTDQLIASETSAIEDTDDLQEGSTYLFALEEILVPVKAEAKVTLSRSEPPEVAGNLYMGMAFELNRRADGLNALLEKQIGQVGGNVNDRIAGSRSEAFMASSRLEAALKLTREAVYAWANLLHAPAVLTINH